MAFLVAAFLTDAARAGITCARQRAFQLKRFERHHHNRHRCALLSQLRLFSSLPTPLIFPSPVIVMFTSFRCHDGFVAEDLAPNTTAPPTFFLSLPPRPGKHRFPLRHSPIFSIHCCA
jgi:hypothetical protein